LKQISAQRNQDQPKIERTVWRIRKKYCIVVKASSLVQQQQQQPKSNNQRETTPSATPNTTG